MENRDVSPDGYILQQIFGTYQPENITIILQNWDKCVFKAELPISLDGRHLSYVVRLEAKTKNENAFNTISAMQKIAANIIPELVPQTFQVGEAKNIQGRIFHFSVAEFLEGDTLEDTWELMNAEQQRSVVIKLVEALKKLHSVRLRDHVAQEILGEVLANDSQVLKHFRQPGVFGGPHTGLMDSGSALLSSILEKRKLKQSFCSLNRIINPHGIRIQSRFEELGSIVIESSDITKLPEEAVFCHNDLTPRNIILQPDSSSGDKVSYRLAGIIDWELAGFYPASYELSLQDTYLSGANRHVSFYLLLKEHMKRLVPRSSSQVALLQTMELIFTSQQRLLSDGTNIPARIRKRFIKNSGLVRDNDPYNGWTRSVLNMPNHEFSYAAFQRLEDKVVKEIAAGRK